MFLGEVTGELVSTLKHRELAGRRLLWVMRCDPRWRPLGRRTLAVDTVDAGPGDHVLVLDEGNGAAQVLGRPRGPIRTVIVGVVDSACLDES
jgi:microcompartment protein CcmK/EutM